MIRLTDLSGNGSFTMGGKKFEYGKVYSNPYATAFKSVNEGKWENIMRGVRSGSQSGPWTIVVIDKSSKKVVHQEPIKIKDSIPAHYEDIKKKYPNKFISIEDRHGKQVYKEIAEGEESTDHEVSMAQSSLDSIIKAATELKQKMGEEEKQIPAWIQDHITNAENYITQASSNYHEYGDSNEVKADEIKVISKEEFQNESGPCWKGYKQVGMKNKNGKEVPNCVPESVMSEASVAKLQSDYAKTLQLIQQHLEKYKSAKNDIEKKKHVEDLKKLNLVKKKIQSDMDKEISSLYKDAELEEGCGCK